MSRTDKDMPPWVVAEWYEPSHAKQYVWDTPGFVCQGCDLPDEPIRQYPNRVRFGRGGHCRWTYVWPWTWGRRSYRHGGGVPKWFVDHVWNAPERRRERDDLRALRDEYNANGYLEDGDFPCWQPRGCARWMWD